jgi:hypothetical protein
LKEALVALYKDYLAKIKQNEELRLKLLHSEQKIKRMDCLHKSIRSIDGRNDLKEPEVPDIRLINDP